MTEEEAKTKWCPFARTVVTIDAYGTAPVAISSANRFHDNTVALCLASACMAWRTKEIQGEPTFADFSGDQRPGSKWYWNYVRKQLRKYNPIMQGFCGLAGPA